MNDVFELIKKTFSSPEELYFYQQIYVHEKPNGPLSENEWNLFLDWVPYRMGKIEEERRIRRKKILIREQQQKERLMMHNKR
jgi:hypothetical protein